VACSWWLPTKGPCLGLGCGNGPGPSHLSDTAVLCVDLQFDISVLQAYTYYVPFLLPSQVSSDGISELCLRTVLMTRLRVCVGTSAWQACNSYRQAIPNMY